MILEIRFFQTARGDEPVRDYIRVLTTKERTPRTEIEIALRRFANYADQGG